VKSLNIEGLSARRLIRKKNGLSKNGTILPIHLKHIDSIGLCNNRDLSNILPYFKSLTELSISGANYCIDKWDLSNINTLSNLKSLTMRNFDLGDKPFLSLLPNLTLLKITNCSGCVSHIGKLNQLQSLYLSLNNGEIMDMSFLKNLRSLKHLYLYGGAATSVNTLGKLENLEYLSVDFNKRLDIPYEPLSKLKNIETFNGRYDVNTFAKLLSLTKEGKLQKLKSVGGTAFGDEWYDNCTSYDHRVLSINLYKYPGCFELTYTKRLSSTSLLNIAVLKNFDIRTAKDFVVALFAVGGEQQFMRTLEKYSYFEYHDIDFMYEGVEL